MIEQSVLEGVLGVAMRTGGEFAEVFAEDRRNSSAVLDDGRVEELTSGRDRGAGIRVVVGDTTGFAHTAGVEEARMWLRSLGVPRLEATKSKPFPAMFPKRRKSNCCFVPTMPLARWVMRFLRSQ
jgi:predicted Zn-dependent protease